MRPQDSTWHGFSDKGKMATGLVLGCVVYDKSRTLCQGCSWLNFPFPQPENNRKTGIRQNLVRSDRALNQVRGPFSWAWLCTSRTGVLGGSGSSGAAELQPWWLGLHTAWLGSAPRSCCSLPFPLSGIWACRRCLSAPKQKSRGLEEGERGHVLGWFHDDALFLIDCFMPRNGCCGFKVGPEEGYEPWGTPVQTSCSRLIAQHAGCCRERQLLCCLPNSSF